VGFEGADEAAEEFAAHVVFLVRQGLDAAAQAEAPELPALDAEDFHVLEDPPGAYQREVGLVVEPVQVLKQISN
jgi:hypothetical protein